jgi:hypothetical protein
MSKLIELASLFRDRAAECVRLAELSTDHESSRDYCHLASCYLLLAENELQRVEQAQCHSAAVPSVSDLIAKLSQTSAIRVNNDPALWSDISEANSRHSAARCRPSSSIKPISRSRRLGW